MFVIKRDKTKEQVHFDKITRRIENLVNNIKPKLENVDSTLIAQKVVAGIYPGVTTTILDNLAAETAAYMTSVHPEYNLLAGRIVSSNLQKETPSKFSDSIFMLNEIGMINENVYKIVMDNKEILNNSIVNDRDFYFDYFGFKTLEKNYLLKCDDKIVERPQYMFMRVSIGIHHNDIKSVIETYNMMSEKYFIHATPTLFNSGTKNNQMSSCFLLSMQDDSIEGIYNTLKQCAMISKHAGGIGLSVTNVRANGSYIKGNNGKSSGIIPMLRNFNETAKYVDQGSKRKGSFAIYLEPWHPDIEDFLELKKNTGNEDMRCRDLFYGLMINDLFMERVENDQEWTLISPNECPELIDLYGKEFNEKYIELEKKINRKVKARQIWDKIIISQIETGTPYMIYKDSVNLKSNQKNIGTIRNSNLCTEIMEVSNKNEIAVCNLASISLPNFITKENDKIIFDHDKLFEVTGIIVNNLNKIIDNNLYPVKECETSNLKNRPIGIGVQGLADLFIKLRFPFESNEAKKLNREIFETIYYSSIEHSIDLAKKYGSYSSFEGSDYSKGIFQFDHWKNVEHSGRWDWNSLKYRIQKYGIRNSLLLAPMPTASTSQILGNNEAFEPYTSNIYNRRVLAGEFIIINKHLVEDLIKLNMWNEEVKNNIIKNNGSVSQLNIDKDIKELYKTVWEIKQKNIIDMAADRAVYIDQSQSMNIFIESPSYDKINSMHFYGWKKGLKTGMYYLRTRPVAKPIQFTIGEVCRKEEGCIVCSS